MTAVVDVAVTAPAAAQVLALGRLVDDAATRADVEVLAAGCRELASLVKALPAKGDLAARARARAASEVDAARIHLDRAGVLVDHARGCRLAAEALAVAVEWLGTLR